MKKALSYVIANIGDKALVKYVMSYLLILSITLFPLFLLYNQYFLSVYSEEVVTQKRNSLEQLAFELDRQMSEYFSIAGQFATQEVMQKRYIYNNSTAYINIQSILKGVASTHSSFSQIAFYSAATPDTVYTNYGSFNISYYKHYICDDGQLQNLKDMLNSIKAATWILPQNSYWPHNIGPKTLDYILPIPESSGSYVIFSISDIDMESIINPKDVQTIIFDKDYTQLYPFSATEKVNISKIKTCIDQNMAQPVKIDGDSYLLCTLSENNKFILTQIIPHEIMYSNIISIQKIFVLSFMSVLFFGGIAAYIMSTLNYRPIRQLNKQIKEKGLDIPSNLYGTDILSFAIQKMDNQYKNLERNTLREKILLKLIHRKCCKNAAFNEQCKIAGLTFNSSIMRIALIFINSSSQQSKNIDIIQAVNAMLSDIYEVNGIEYLENNCYLFSIGYNNEQKHILAEKLSYVTSQLAAYTGSSIKIAVGGACNTIEHLPESYIQAMWISKNSTASDAVLFHDDNSVSNVPFIYPKIDIDALYNAIMSGSVDKIRFITDMLVDMIQENCHNNFISTSLCFDIINTYLRAIDKLNISTANMLDSYTHYYNLNELTDIRSFIDMIYNLQEDSLQLISKKIDNSQSNHIIAEVIDFINKNYKNEDLCVSYVAEKFNMSISNLSHQFKDQTGLNISDFIAERRLIFAKELLQDSKLTINDIAIRLGYNQASSFIRKFKKYMKCTPSEYRISCIENQ